MDKKDILQYKSDFLLELANNNYSPETVYNYSRDLSVFEGFLFLNGLQFEDVDKRIITHYKGFLRSPNHYLDQLESVGWKIDIDEFSAQGNLIPKKINTGLVGPLNAEFLEAKNPDLIMNQKADTSIRKYHGEQIGARTINRMLSALRSYLKYLIDFDLKPVPVAPEAIKLIKIERRDSQVAEFSELIKLIECPSELEKDSRVALRNRAMLEMLFSTGMRISELLRLNRRDLNEKGKIYVMGKGKKQRLVYLTDRATFYINEYLNTRIDNNPALFIPYRGGRNNSRGVRVSANYLQEKIAEYRKILGIVVPTSAHSLRHGFATYLAEQGANAAAIQILLGHESLHTTSRYVHPSDKFAERVHHDYHPLYEVNSAQHNDEESKSLDTTNSNTKDEQKDDGNDIENGIVPEKDKFEEIRSKSF